MDESLIHTRVTSADREDDLTDVHTSDGAVWLAEGTTHSGLQSIGTSARQHLVDADDVVWVRARGGGNLPFQRP